MFVLVTTYWMVSLCNDAGGAGVASRLLIKKYIWRSNGLVIFKKKGRGYLPFFICATIE